MANIRNIGRVVENVGVILSDGRKATIRVMPRNPKGVTLPEGSTLDPNWMALYGQYIKLFDDPPVFQVRSSEVPDAPSVARDDHQNDQ